MADLALWVIMICVVFSICPNLKRIVTALERIAPMEGDDEE
jgi:hypothetical protein